MRPLPIVRILPVLLIAGTVAACGSARAGTAGTAPEPKETADLEAIYQARQDSARTQFTQADVRFMTAMIGHHAQALVMTALAPTHGASPQVQTLAARIANSQRGEIAQMQQWLRERGQPVPQYEIDGTELHLQGTAHGMHAAGVMPGMLTQEQLEELDRARGAEFDRLFLTYMIQHHLGAVAMVNELVGTDGAALDDTVFRLASDVQADQKTEIARMEQMLEALAAERPVS